MSERYAEEAGANARKAAAAARAGEHEKCLRLARGAVADGDLMHPACWRAWMVASDDLFTQALATMSAKERPKLLSALAGNHANAHERLRSHWGCVCAFAQSPAKLAALESIGADLSAPGSALLLTAADDWVGLGGLMRAGAPSPRAPTRDELSLAGASEAGASLLLILASRGLGDLREGSVALAVDVARWLSRGSSFNVRDGKGRDALKVAISLGKARLAGALLEAGASPSLLDAKGRDALEFLEASKQGALAQGRRSLAEAIENARPALSRALERRVLVAAAQTGQAQKTRSGL